MRLWLNKKHISTQMEYSFYRNFNNFTGGLFNAKMGSSEFYVDYGLTSKDPNDT